MSDSIKLKGRIVFEFEEHEDGQWYSRVTPEMSTTNVREVYKLALITAVLQDTCKNKLELIDRLIMNNADISAMAEEQKGQSQKGE